jgi:hypothetical protein
VKRKQPPASKEPGPPDVQWEPKIEYLAPRQGYANDKVAWHVNTFQEAQSMVNYWKRWVPNAPHRVVKATTTYEYVDEGDE